jgi:immune inhibitor A
VKRRHISVLSGVAAAAVALCMAPAQAQAIPAQGDKEPKAAHRDHDLPNPLGDAQRELRKEAIDKLIKGEATTEMRGGQRVIKLAGNKAANKNSKAAKDRFVSYPVEREESIFTILSEFNDLGQNEIAEPDRTWDGNSTDDNSTYWTGDFSRAHYMDMLFGEGESFKDFYLKQSNGRFLASGDVSEWVSLPGAGVEYGNNEDEGAAYWKYVTDTVNAWYDAQVASGKSAEQINAYLAQFDKVDRYDADGDGNFAESDGYIDHFQAIHAGEGEEAGGGTLGEDAIWSHRWYVNSDQVGKTGPGENKLGGVQIGGANIWVGDYTTEPENGGLGVFAHEFGHDLGLPDLYDTAGGDNGTGFWTLMSGGSWLNHGGDSIGTTPGYMGPWEKLQLGWLDYEVVRHGTDATVKLGPADRDSVNRAQAVAVVLPRKTVTEKFNDPHSGSHEWWGGSADNLQNTLARPVDLTGKTSASMSAWLEYEIEEGYDYLYVEASENGSDWTTLDTIDGASDWAQKTWDLSAFAGKQIQVRFRYATDGGLHYAGPFIDDIAITADGASQFSDDVESGVNGWTADGFTQMTGTITQEVSHYYLAENRVYQGYDATLATGPYNFGWGNTKPDWVERFPYQNGLLVWYSDGAYTDNNTRSHPGGGEALPVDARPAPVTFPDGARLGNRRQPWDATFGLERTDKVTFHRNGVPVTVKSQPAMPTFDDSDPNRYWTEANPWASTKVAGSGTRITVVDGTGDNMEVRVTFQ